MKKSMVLIILLLVLTVWVMPAAAITWGELDTEHTNVGAMVVDFPNRGRIQFCSGTLIHPKVFLTAAHCVDAFDDFGITEVWVNFDQNALKLNKLLDVEQSIMHPDYNEFRPSSNPHDVAALILKRSVKNLTPATLPEKGFLNQLKADGKLDGAKFTVVGYGLQEAPEFKDESERRFAQADFQGLLKAWLRTSQNHSANDDVGGICGGDSGGPAFWTEPDGSEILVGIISWGDVPCKTVGFNYRVDTKETLEFIQNVIDSAE